MRKDITVALLSPQHRQRGFAENFEGAQKAHSHGESHGCQQAPSEHHGLNGPGNVQEKMQALVDGVCVHVFIFQYSIVSHTFRLWKDIVCVCIGQFVWDV